MVSLRTKDETKYPAAEIYVDTIKLSERFGTGLAGGREGDHTISDVVNKKYQKLMVRNKSVTNMLTFYKEQSQQLIQDNEMFWGSDNKENEEKIEETAAEVEQTVVQENDVSMSALLVHRMPGKSKRTMSRKAAAIREGTTSQKVPTKSKRTTSREAALIRMIMMQWKEAAKREETTAREADKKDAYHDEDKIAAFRENFEKRCKKSNQLAKGVIDYIGKVAKEKQTAKEWRRTTENIVNGYNSALAKGMLTTSPIATGGKGERAGKDAIRSYASRHFVTKEEEIAAAVEGKRLVDLPDVGQVLDILSAEALVMISGGVMDIPAYLMSKTAGMVTDMKARYREKEEETRQWLRDNPSIWLPDIDANGSFLGNTMSFIREKFIKDSSVQDLAVQTDVVQDIVKVFSSDELKKLRERYWHSIF